MFLGLFLLLASIVFSNCHALHKHKHKDTYGVLLPSLDGYAPLINRPRFQGKRASETDGIKKSRVYNELRKITNDESSEDRYILVEIPNEENDERKGISSETHGKSKDKNQSKIWGRLHRYRYLMKKPSKRTVAVDQYEYDYQRSGRSANEEKDETEVLEKSDKKETPPRKERFGNTRKRDTNIQRFGPYGKDDIREAHRPRWGRFGKKEAPRWGRFGKEVDVIVVDDGEVSHTS